MKYQGRIQHWDDAKGFGFVEPNGGGTRAFVHISSFLKRSRRPVNGDIIVYEMKEDGKGGHKAASVKLLKDYKNVRSQHNAGKSGSKVPKLVVTVYCSALVLLNLIGQLPVNVTYFCAVISAIAFSCYGIDKSAAKHQRWRISESKLHILGFLGGWPGAFIAQHVFKHKRSKPAFMRVFWATAALNAFAVGVLASNVLTERWGIAIPFLHQ